MGSAVLTNAVATYVTAFRPTNNYDPSATLAGRTGGAGDVYAYLFFARPFPLRATILSAQIVFYTQAMAEAVTHTWTFQRLNQSFAASKVTYNTRPTNLIAGTKTVSKTGTQADKVEWTLDVTDWMQTVANGGVWYGVQIRENEAIVRWMYSESNPATAYRPRLEVTWSDAPATPTGLAPSSGRKVGVNKPVLRATYIDVSGATQLQALQVQINSTDSWGAPAFDSGTVLTSVPELALASTAYGGLSDGQTVYWRIRFQDAAGIWSAYSAATTFQYDTKGTLTLTSPSSGTPTVEDATPPILWTFTGETQAAYQLQFTHLENNAWVTDWDSGKVTSTATSVTVPAGKINEPSSTTYTVTLRVWDNKSREATPGDPTYSEVVRQFTFVPGATNPVPTVLATVGDPRPYVDLTWARAVAPDRFNVLRNGKVIQAALDPEDVLTSAGTFSSLRTIDNFNSSLGLWHISTGGGTLTRDTNTPIEGTHQARVVRTWAASGADFYRLDNGPLTTTNQSASGNTFQIRVRLASGGPTGITVQAFLYGGSPLADRAGPVLELIPGTIQDYRASFETAYVTAMQHITLEFRRASSTAVSTTIDFDNVQQGSMTATFGWRDNSPSPGRSLVYQVQAVVNDVASSSNDTDTVTVRSAGVWLREPDSGLELFIAGADDREFTLGDQSAALKSIAQTANSVLIHQSLGGLEGRIEGVLTSFAGKTAQQWRDQMILMRNLRVKRFWLTVGDYTYQVVAQNFSLANRASADAPFRVGFDVYQQDSLNKIILGS